MNIPELSHVINHCDVRKGVSVTNLLINAKEKSLAKVSACTIVIYSSPTPPFCHLLTPSPLPVLQFVTFIRLIVFSLCLTRLAVTVAAVFHVCDSLFLLYNCNCKVVGNSGVRRSGTRMSAPLSGKREILFAVIILVTVANKSLDIGLRILISKKGLRRDCRVKSAKRHFRAPFLTNFCVPLLLATLPLFISVTRI